MTIPDLCSYIEDVMQCIASSFVLGLNESYIESIGSVLEHHNPKNRATSLHSVSNEVIISWNGPTIMYCDVIDRDTLYRMFGKN